MGQATTLNDCDYLYAVFVEIGDQRTKHVVIAKSDYHAAVKVKKATGSMPVSERDVVGPIPGGMCSGLTA